MSLYILTNGQELIVGIETFAQILEGHPFELAERAHALSEAGADELIDEADVPFRVGDYALIAAKSLWFAQIQENHPLTPNPASPGFGVPRYRFVRPPEIARSPTPMPLSDLGETQIFSTYREGDADWEEALTIANEALVTLGELKYRIDLPIEGSPERQELISLWAARLNAIGLAAQHFAIVEDWPNQVHLALAPGNLPGPILNAITDFLEDVTLIERLDLPLLRKFSIVMGFEADDQTFVPLSEIDEHYDTAQDRFDAEIGDALKGISKGVGSGQGWFVEGEDLAQGTLTSSSLKRGSGKHIIIPELPITETPTDIPPMYPPTLSSFPIAFCLSDLHMGQGTAVDNADDVYPNLDTAFLGVLNDWSGRVTLHRLSYGNQQPAHLVLHGDVLDFWSADMIPRPGGGNRFDADVANDNGKPVVNRTVAQGRMDRIMKAHKPFFDAITAWVNSHPLNFVTYVCGNHDDHLVRYGLGPVLAARLHPDRGAFAAQDLYFPQLKTLIEHGHREDKYNTPAFDDASFPIGSLGEMIVSMMINPIERGGAGYLTQIHANNEFSGFLNGAGLDNSDFSDLFDIYSHLRKCWEVRNRTYEAYLGSIDNLDNGGLEDAVADFGGRRLVEADAAKADAADVADLDEDIKKMKSLWLQSDFQGMKEWVGGALTHVFSPNFQTHLVEKYFSGNHAKDLGFRPGRGLNGRRSMKVHVVGHTHAPSATAPALGTGFVPAQHINTGTGQDTWRATDTGAPDIFDLGMTPFAVQRSRDSLKPVPRSQYCLLKVLPGDILQIEGGDFRTIQAYDPINVGSAPIHGRASGGASNFVRL